MPADARVLELVFFFLCLILLEDWVAGGRDLMCNKIDKDLLTSVSACW